MDPLFDRLGRMFRSWGIDSDRDQTSTRSMDPDQRAAEEELEAFLRGDSHSHEEHSDSHRSRTSGMGAHSEHATPMDPKVLTAFRTLGLDSNASWAQISTAHRQLLKQHHPDRHSDNAQQTQKATLQSQVINEAFQLLKKYRGQ